MAEAPAHVLTRPALGPVTLAIHQDAGSGIRYVMREHTNGFSRSVLQWRPDEKRWRTITHVERMFEDP